MLLCGSCDLSLVEMVPTWTLNTRIRCWPSPLCPSQSNLIFLIFFCCVGTPTPHIIFWFNWRVIYPQDPLLLSTMEVLIQTKMSVGSATVWIHALSKAHIFKGSVLEWQGLGGSLRSWGNAVEGDCGILYFPPTPFQVPAMKWVTLFCQTPVPCPGVLALTHGWLTMGTTSETEPAAYIHKV
jgi:hypothetical protein